MAEYKITEYEAVTEAIQIAEYKVVTEAGQVTEYKAVIEAIKQTRSVLQRCPNYLK